MPRTKTERMHCTREEWREAQRRWGARVDDPPESGATTGVAAGSSGSDEIRPLTQYSNRELVTLHQEKAACFAMFQTKVLFDRTKQIDAELMRRLAAYPNNEISNDRQNGEPK